MLGENLTVPMLQAWDRLSCHSLVDRVFHLGHGFSAPQAEESLNTSLLLPEQCKYSAQVRWQAHHFVVIELHIIHLWL